MKTPFTEEKLKFTFLGFGKKRNALIEFKNLFALSTANHKKIKDIETKYNVDFNKDFFKERIKIYSTYLRFCEEQNMFQFIPKIKELLYLKDTNKIDSNTIEAVSIKFYDFIKEHKELPSSEDFIKTLPFDKNLVNDISNKIKIRICTEVAQKYLDELISDNRFSPEEEKKFRNLCENFSISMSDSTFNALQKYRDYWSLENAELQPISVDSLRLTKGEICYYTKPATLLKLKKVTNSMTYHGPTLRIPICKGLSYRIGNITPITHTSTELIKQDCGTLYITNKRIIFMGTLKNTVVQMNKILKYTPYSDGIEIQKESGINPVFQIENIDLNPLFIVLSRLLKND